ncbi:O-succinylbenzoic acid--CoA ligase [Aeromicrobium marinum DSM 15272]|uniref:O-succinylbenzoic acid--CoA ligase n=1 Tax=Aeromicrobium marinum DSM 15272 TaxID=585531 RepID=E2SF19_9ACTN|nr:AMP-binding protein [Aeromicrobium marinum]EFQ82263.1 O-succinylbenzoic acid--CoA ligase [Aeromicrobium marinum DSM 15272]
MTVGLRPLSGSATELVPLLRAWLDGDEPLWVRTSGSTGRPKDVVLSPAAVRASVAATHERLGGPGQWLLALPPTGVAGLQVVVRSLLAGFVPAEDRSDLTAPRRYVSVVPTQLHRIVAGGEVGEWAGFDAVLVGGAAVPQELVARARDLGLPVVRTYGMSETCGGCVYDGVPLDGVEVRIDDDQQVHVAGPVLFDGYRDEPRVGEWFATADLGEWVDGRLRILGRRDDVVVSGGVNVPLPAVTAALQAADGVGDALAVGVPDDEWGQRVVAVVVPGESVCLDALRLDALRDVVEAAGHPRTWAPRDVVLVDAIPMLPNGKPDRAAARALAGP